jgi:hypothetical protein
METIGIKYKGTTALVPVKTNPIGIDPIGTSVPIGTVPTGIIPIGTTPIGTIPIGTIPTTPMDITPIETIPTIPMGITPIGIVPLGTIKTILNTNEDVSIPIRKPEIISTIEPRGTSVSTSPTDQERRTEDPTEGIIRTSLNGQEAVLRTSMEEKVYTYICIYILRYINIYIYIYVYIYM